LGYSWYEEVEFDLPITQGDILLNFPIPIIEEKEEYPYYNLSAAYLDVIIITQACDLENGKVDFITFCVIESLSEITMDIMIKRAGPELNFSELSANQRKMPMKIVEELEQGYHLNFHLLNKNSSGENCTTIDQEFKVVLLKETYKVPIESVKKIIDEGKANRLRLLPPYREHLAQAYANVFSRIGLPIDIDKSNVNFHFL
jgi:hypothetical protein